MEYGKAEVWLRSHLTLSIDGASAQIYALASLPPKKNSKFPLNSRMSKLQNPTGSFLSGP
jgi:hypothetical protein